MILTKLKKAVVMSKMCQFVKSPAHAFATGSQYLDVTSKLIEMNSIELDNLCEHVLENYNRNQGKGARVSDVVKRQQFLSDRRKIMGTLGNQSRIKEKNVNYSAQLIKFLYDEVSNAKVGFLKGDIHSQLVFKMHKYLKSLPKENLAKQISPQQLKYIFNQITILQQFRLPKKGIKNSKLQDIQNMHQRQLKLQSVSNDQSFQRLDIILQALNRMGKLNLTHTLSKYQTQWVQPLCASIREEQNKCKDQTKLEGNRRKYAQDFLKFAPQKLAVICVSQICKQILRILYKDFIRQNPSSAQSAFQENVHQQLQQYDSIRYKSMCVNIAKHIVIQQAFEQSQLNFTMVMKIYDNHKKSYKEQTQFLNKKKKQLAVKFQNLQSKPNQLFQTFRQNKQSQAEGGEISIPKSIEQLTSQLKKEEKQLQQNQKKLYQSFTDNLKKIKQTYNQAYVRPFDRKTHLDTVADKLKKDYYKVRTTISEQVQFLIGDLLIYLMKEIIKVQNSMGLKVPLLTLQMKYIKKEDQILIDKRFKINQNFLNTILPQIEKEQNLFMHLQRSLPTIIPPMPWQNFEIGGYYLYPSSFMRTSECQVQQKLVKFADLSRIFSIINSLSKIPWKINRRVLSVVEDIWIEGGSKGQIPKRYSQLIIPLLTILKSQKNYGQRYKINKKIQKLRDQHSLRSDFNLKLTLARCFGRLDKFYYPQNIDFRGRVYTISPHLNHIGNDLSRGLLLFANPKKLGKNGLKWLKIHCANLLGKDKLKLTQKLQFIQANVGLIRSIASKPLENREWLDYEDSWQALAAIFQLNDALNHKNPEQFQTCIHVHQDGSCNGLQHYAALGRDMQAAFQVNLGPTQQPGDVYTHVSKMVTKMIDQDIANPLAKSHHIAKKLSGNIKRKTIKQTVMTSVYGVTFIGAKDQILKQLRDQDFLQSQQQQLQACSYLARLTLKAISNLFKNAHQIKQWLIDCAGKVAEQGNPMGWITPLGLPIVQPYRKQSSLDVINSVIQELTLSRHSQNLPVNKLKQKSAFPPNFVHSLDSTHMLYTAERCIKQGIDFAAVHDSYWTHPSDVQKMNKILRQQFIRLHSQPLLQNLKMSLQLRYPEIKFGQIPKRGEFNLQNVKQSIYFFS